MLAACEQKKPGPETYYDYRGRHLGTQYMLAQRFADKIGVSLRMEVCRDSAEMIRRLLDGEADLVCYPVRLESTLVTIARVRQCQSVASPPSSSSTE